MHIAFPVPRFTDKTPPFRILQLKLYFLFLYVFLEAVLGGSHGFIIYSVPTVTTHQTQRVAANHSLRPLSANGDPFGCIKTSSPSAVIHFHKIAHLPVGRRFSEQTFGHTDFNSQK